MRRLTLILSTALSAIVANAQEDTLQSYDLDVAVYSVSREENDADLEPKSVSVITEEQIESSNYLNVSELLSQEAGIHTVGAHQNPGGNVQSIFLRGTNSNQVLIMVDGVRITDQTSPGNAPNLAEISLADVARVEIVNGGHSVMYGSSAVGGVVNIITKKAKTPGLHGDVNLQGGYFGESTSVISENVNLRYMTKSGFYTTGSVFHQTVNGQDATVDTVTDATAFKNLDNDDFIKLDLVGKVGYRSDKSDIYVYYKRSDQQADIDDGAFRDDENYISEFIRNSINFGLNHEVNEKLSVNLVAGYSSMNRFLEDDSSVVDTAGNTDGNFYTQTNKGQSFTTQGQVNYTSKYIKFVAGFGLYNEQYNSVFSGVSAWGPYSGDNSDQDIKVLMANQFFSTTINGRLISESLDKLNIRGGFRYTTHSDFGGNTVYEVSPSYQVSKSSMLYFNLASSFNAPSLYQLTDPSAGNSNLEPETGFNMEFGAKIKISNKLRISLAAFRSETKNMIEYVNLYPDSIPPVGWPSSNSYVNLNTQVNQGIEFRWDSKICNKWRFGGNLTFMDNEATLPTSAVSEFLENQYVQVASNGVFVNDTSGSFSLARRPNFLANARVTYNPIDDLSVGLIFKYVGSREGVNDYGTTNSETLEAYELLDFTARYSISEKTSLFLRVENVLGKNYSEIFGYSARNRGVYLKLAYNF